MTPAPDRHLLDALTKAYIARAKLFHNGIRTSKIDLLITEIDTIDPSELQWDHPALRISTSAWERVEATGGSAHQVFAHPSVIQRRPHLVAYYRNLVAISKKGISQILFSTDAYESGRKDEMSEENASRLCKTLNQILSGVIDELPEYCVELSRQAILAEIGTELQGTWANIVGVGAAKQVEQLLDDYIGEHKIGQHIERSRFRLNNGWEIRFGSEPDVAFIDSDGVTRIAIEIKGSLDVAGAQTRYGETKKSFAKVLGENPRCHTIYLASCFTEAVIDQIRTDDQVRDWFNLTSILYDAQERTRFLERLFHVVNMPT